MTAGDDLAFESGCWSEGDTGVGEGVVGWGGVCGRAGARVSAATVIGSDHHRRKERGPECTPLTGGPGTLGLNSTVIIVVNFGEDVQQYAAEFAQLAFPRPSLCPGCATDGPVVGHGSYPRTVTDPTRAVAIRVKRLLCTACRHTIALLPSFCLPFRHYQSATIQTVLTARVLGPTSWNAIARRFAPADLPSPTSCREWVAAFGHASMHYLPHLVAQLARWSARSSALEVILADLARVATPPGQLIAAVPHLVAWLGEVGVPVAGRPANWLATLGAWGNGVKLGRLV